MSALPPKADIQSWLGLRSAHQFRLVFGEQFRRRSPAGQ